MSKKIKLEVTKDGEMAYLYLLDHPGKGTPGASVKTISLASFINNYKGIETYLDFDVNGVLIGMEFFIE